MEKSKMPGRNAKNSEKNIPPQKQVNISASMKLFDLVELNYKLLLVLSRFDINLGFGEVTIGDICKRNNISIDWFIVVCKVYTLTDYIPGSEDLKHIDLKDIVSYLHNSHKHYTEYRMPKLRSKFDEMIDSCEPLHKKILTRFFDDYKEELTNHFEYEENTVFPYVYRLIDGHQSEGYYINQFEENHGNIEEKLDDLKNIILKYLPINNKSELYNEVLIDIFQFEDDLERHTSIENNILIPVAAKLEKDE